MSRVEIYASIIVILFIAMSVVAIQRNKIPDDYYAANCATCHGERGEKSAHGLSSPLRELTAEEIVTIMTRYRDEQGNFHGSGATMRVQVEDLDDDQIQQLADHIKSLK